jgi:hypothetical protein
VPTTSTAQDIGSGLTAGAGFLKKLQELGIF